MSPSRTYHPYKLFVWLVAILLLIIGLGVRLSDLTDEPLDFHPTRQLRGAIIARGIYYEMLPNADPQLRKMAVNFANSTGQYEPPILETLVAYTYRIIGGEHLWVARIYSSIFWIIGGIALFVLAKRMFNPNAALVSLGYYLLLPFSTQASRSFQPDPSMVMWLILTVYALFRWSQDQRWKWTILAGVFGGMTIITKAVSVYIVAAAALAIVLSTLGFRQSLRRIQVWVIAALMVAPSAIYYLVQHQGRASEYFANWTLALSRF